MGPDGLEVINRDGSLGVLKDPESALEVLRHSTSHLMALAVIDLFPDVHLGIGPATADGFYYDFQSPHRFSEEDLSRIEARMNELKQQGLSFEPSIVEKEDALRLFEEKGEALKTELIAGRDSEVLSCYRLGKLVDFCTGPHVRSTASLATFKLLSIAGSYWRGDEYREQLQRIYGTAFFSDTQLADFLSRLEEARKRDHRKLGRELDLFSVEDHVAPGLILWHPSGAQIRAQIEDLLRVELRNSGYEFVYTPHIAKSDLWKTSGHYEYFRENMYTLELDNEEYVLKPMNCPGHILIYKSDLRSYRDLPIRLAEFGTVYRHEKSGTLHGMLRVRGFTQDDAHIFCRPDQVKDEVVATLNLAGRILDIFGFSEFKVTLSVWDSSRPSDYAGSREDWIEAERVLVGVLDEKGWTYERAEGEAAFYGPKIDIQLIDALGRAWQLSTFQFDFNLPARFDVTYVGSDSRPHHVVMVHRALLGSLERFVGVLIEHYAGAFPVWLAPMQAVVLPISEKHHDYARRVEGTLVREGFRVKADLRNEKLGYKIRDNQLKKIPFMLICGDREIESGTVSVRSRSDGDLGSRPLQEFSVELKEMVEARVLKS